MWLHSWKLIARYKRGESFDPVESIYATAKTGAEAKELGESMGYKVEGWSLYHLRFMIDPEYQKLDEELS